MSKSPYCSVAGCDRAVLIKSRGLCRTHYKWFLKGKPLDTPIQVYANKSTCYCDGCDKRATRKGLCGTHYQRLRTTGTLEKLTSYKLDADDTFALYADIRDTDECIEWQGTISNQGYAVMVVKRKPMRAQRFAYAKFNGPLPRDKVVRHTCDNPPCVNPRHLVIGTPKQNSADMVERDRSLKGERHFRHRLTEADVIGMRLGSETAADCARRTGVEYSTAKKARCGKNWQYLNHAYPPPR